MKEECHLLATMDKDSEQVWRRFVFYAEACLQADFSQSKKGSFLEETDSNSVVSQFPRLLFIFEKIYSSFLWFIFFIF